MTWFGMAWEWNFLPLPLGSQVFLRDKCAGAGSLGAECRGRVELAKHPWSWRCLSPSLGVISVAVGMLNTKPAPVEDCAFQPWTEKVLGRGKRRKSQTKQARAKHACVSKHCLTCVHKCEVSAGEPALEILFCFLIFGVYLIPWFPMKGGIFKTLGSPSRTALERKFSEGLMPVTKRLKIQLSVNQINSTFQPLTARQLIDWGY